MVPLRVFCPQTISDIAAIVSQAERDETTVRAVGSGHSWSDIALTAGYLIDTRGLDRDLEVDCARSSLDLAQLTRSEAGIRLSVLGKRLEQRGQALAGMGGAGQQTLAGVLATATHGSGLAYGPLCDEVASIDLVGAGGQIYRIEPVGDNVTDPPSFRAAHPDWELRQDDDWFRSAQVGLGSLGIVYAVTLKTRSFYYLSERRKTTKWSKVANQLLDGALLRENDHVEIYINPHERDGDHVCVVTARNRATEPARSRAARRRPVVPQVLGAISPVTWAAAAAIARLRPSSVPRLLDRALKAVCDPLYVDKWYRVLSIGRVNTIPAYSMEIGVALDDTGSHVAAVRTVLEVAARRRRLGGVHSTGPIALRFVRASTAFMAMMSGRDTMMIELIQLSGTRGALELLMACEEALGELGGRPHWGQYNTFPASDHVLLRMYPEWPRWRAVHAVINSSGVFDSPFAKRIGISRKGI